MENNRIKWILFLVLLVTAFLFLFTGCILMPRRSFPKERGAVSIQGLIKPVEVVRDKYGVPHIYAQTVEDLFFAQGYVQAQDRFWQMELYRRAGSGRLSEIFGKDLLSTDIFYRTLGYNRVAALEYEQIEGEPRKVAESFAAGITAYIKSQKPIKLGYAYALLKFKDVEYEVEDWTPVDTFVFAKMMADTLSDNFRNERTDLDGLYTVGLDPMLDFIYQYQDDVMPFIVSDEEMGIAAADTERQPLALSPVTPRGTNTWVISGDLTATGKPILASDEHLGIGIPSIFYEMGLHLVDGNGNPITEKGKNYNVRGFTFPGHPFVMIGHNARIAWGVAYTGIDNQDLYIERINPMNPDQYEVNGEWVDMKIIHERIDIEGEDDPYILRVRKTRHGPIISDQGSYAPMTSFFLTPDLDFPENVGFTAISLKWTALEPRPLLPAFEILNQADNFEEFRDAMRLWATPSTSMTYADVDGNIGYYCPPPIPIRSRGEGRLPSPGWTDDYEWEGYVPFEELPYSYNPPKGYIVACNNPPVSENYPYFIGSTSSLGFRAKRAADMIEADEDGITLEDMKKMQADVVDAGALEIVPYLENLDLSQKDWLELEKLGELMEEETDKERKKREEQEAEEQEAFEVGRERLLEWDRSMEIESAEAALYGFLWQKLVEETFKDQFPEARWSDFNVERALNSYHILMQKPLNFWWDDIRSPDLQENRDDILIRAFRKAYRDAVKEFGEDMDKWEWGKIHQAEFREQTMGESGIGFVERIFNRGPVATRGAGETLSVGAWRVDEAFNHIHIAACRQIVDLSDIGNSVMMHVPGQSGHPKHKHYDDLIEPWRLVEYHPSLFHRDDIEGGTVLTLKPAAASD